MFLQHVFIACSSSTRNFGVQAYPNADPQAAGKLSRAVSEGLPCLYCATATCHASTSSHTSASRLSEHHLGQASRQHPDDQFDQQKGRPAVVQQPLKAAPRTNERYRTEQQPRISQGAAPQACITSMHRTATARRYQLVSCPCSPPSCCARCTLPPTRPTSSSKPRGCLPA